MHYDADYCDVVQSRTDLTFIFGRLKPGLQQLRTKIEIAFSQENFMRQVWYSSRKVHDSAKKVSVGKELIPLEGLSDPDKVQCFRSNNVLMALLASESVIDFFYISPGDVHLATKQRKSEIPLESVIRVVLSTPLLVEFLNKCESFADQLKNLYKEEDR